VAEVADGTIVDGRYTIERRLGSGGMADVYCAQDSQLGRQIALKVLHRRFARDQEFVERFRREASAAAGLQHPNVVGVFDRGEYDGTYYIAMEYLPGRTLKEVIRDEAPLDQLRAIDYGIQILQAASFAHRRGVIHRDFKPHNVIVGADDRLKVTDFGIARAGASEMTETGSIMGTAQYLSPEQAQGQRVGAPSDLYSIGVTLFEMLTARVPFTGESAVSIALKHVSEEPPPLRTLRPDVHPRLEQAVGRALLKDPAQRYASADEFIAALEQARAAIASGDNGGGTSTFVPLAPPEEHDPRGRRWPLVVLALLLLGLALGAGLWQLLKTEQVTVPQVVGKTANRATLQLQDAGFIVRTHAVEAKEKPGTVVKQDPAARTQADKGSTVDLAVSSGPGQQLVPDVSNLPRQQAIQALNDAGFRVAEDPQPSSKVQKGNAIKTSPPANKPIPKGSEVRLFVSSGPPQVSVPSVVGLDKAVASAKIKDAGLNLTQELVDSDTTPKGRVVTETPSGGSRVDKGTTVALQISRGPQKVNVPDVVTQKRSDAEAALRSAGLTVKVVERESSTDTPGTVLSQSPPGGTNVTKGATVTIVVAKAPPGAGPGTGTSTTPGATTTPSGTP
jgi:serine/threonine-protein kinase